MGIIFNLFVLSIGGIFGSVFLNKRFEEMVPMSVMIIIFTLFIFYMLNIPLVGFYLIHLVNYILLIMSARKFYREKDKRKDYLSNFFTPGLLIFGIVCFVIYLVTKNNFIMAFDELRLWALYPKSIFVTDKLMLGSSNFFSTEYFPGMPLFQYFFAKNIGYFSESHLFISYSIVCLSVLLPITKKIKWKEYWAIVPMILLLFTFPMFFANSGFDMQYYYKSLFIDPALGIFFGYSLFLSTRNIKSNQFNLILFCLSISMVILMKTVGFVLSFCALLSYFINQIFIYKNVEFKKNKFKENLFVLIPVIFFLLTFLSWQMLTKPFIGKHYIQSPEIASVSKISSAIDLFVFPNADQNKFKNNYLDYIIKTPIIVNENPVSQKITVPVVCGLYLIVLLLLFFSVNKNKNKILISCIFCGLFSVITYLMLHLWVYVYTFNYNVLCYGRYISSAIGGLSIFTLLLLFDMSKHIKKKHIFNFLISIIIILYCINFPKLSNRTYYQKYKKDSDNLSNIILSKTENRNENVRIMTLYNHCDSYTYICSLYQHYLYLSLFDDGIHPTPEGMYVVNTSEPFFNSPINGNNFYDEAEKYDYLFVIEDILEIKPVDKNILGDNLKAGDLFKIIKTEDNKNKLLKIN